MTTINSTSANMNVPALVMKVSELEYRIRLAAVNDSDIDYFAAADAHLLKCTQMKSILTALTKHNNNAYQEEDDETEEEEDASTDKIFGVSCLQCSSSVDACSNEYVQQQDDDSSMVRVIFCQKDVTLHHNATPHQQQQQQQKPQHDVIFVEESYIPQTNEDIYNLLRRILCCSRCSTNTIICQCTSPWSQQTPTTTTTTVCVLLPSSSSSVLLVQQLCNFRVGDAAPSFYLHCMVPIELEQEQQQDTNTNHTLSLIQSLQSHISNNTSTSNNRKSSALLMVYRQLPPRFHLQPSLMLFSDYFQQYNLSSLLNISINDSNKSILHANTTNIATTASALLLWELYYPAQQQQHEEHRTNNTNLMMRSLSFRLVTSPYMKNWKLYYEDVLSHFLDPIHFRALQEEARNIPQWTPWPEQQHTSSSRTDDDSSNSTWTVFPLVHTFPAQDVSNRKWIESTCSYCPQTIKLLKYNNCLKDKLRTALFSRLGPNTTLQPHTGWEDLANHVLRIHIPVIVPSLSSCAGTWVDGCVTMHEEGAIQIFDDSKVHRAFNYHSKEERIVLILDLVRPPNVPIGTAVGGHTEELDKFINDMM